MNQAIFTEVNFTELDRTLFELLRLKLVEAQLLPDILEYATAEEFEQAQVTWEDTGNKTLVSLYGTGGNEARDRTESNRILIDRKKASPGSVGGGGYYHVPLTIAGGKVTRWRKKKRPEQTSMVSYQIRLITNSVETERRIMGVIYEALGIKRFVPILVGEDLSTTRKCLLNYTGDIDINATEFTERVFMYTFVDVWLDMTGSVVGERASMNSVEFTLGTINAAKTAKKIVATFPISA